MAKRNESEKISEDRDLVANQQKKPKQDIPLSPSKITGPNKRAHVEAIVRSIFHWAEAIF